MTFAYIAIGTALVTAAASVRQGQAAQASANFQAAQEEENAKQASQIAGAQEDEQRARARQVIGTQMAAQAQSGAQLSGSASDMLRQSLFNAEADALQIRYGGENQSRGLRTQATASRASGRLSRSNANLNAAGSLMSGLGQSYGYSTQAKLNAAKAGG